MWTPSDARRLAKAHLGDLGERWDHVRGCGELAESLEGAGLISPLVVTAAWLHDIGYAPALKRTGFHSIDGALYVRDRGAPTALVALVAHHTGAHFEAEERDLQEEFAGLPEPDVDELDALTLVDLSVGPTGKVTTPPNRIAEVRKRYPADHVVARAIRRSGPQLVQRADRTRSRLGLPDDWPLGVTKGVGDAEPHRWVQL